MVDGNGSKNDIFKKLSLSFSASDFPTRPDSQKMIHSVSNLKIKETSFITINNNVNVKTNLRHQFDHDDVIKKDRTASRIEI